METRNIPPAGDPFAAVAVDDPRQLTIYDMPGVGDDPATIENPPLLILNPERFGEALVGSRDHSGKIVR